MSSNMAKKVIKIGQYNILTNIFLYHNSQIIIGTATAINNIAKHTKMHNTTLTIICFFLRFIYKTPFCVLFFHIIAIIY
mgnify:CR=1 FL=1